MVRTYTPRRERDHPRSRGEYGGLGRLFGGGTGITPARAGSTVYGSRYMRFSDIYTDKYGMTLNDILEKEANDYKKAIKDDLIAKAKGSKVSMFDVYSKISSELNGLSIMESQAVSDIWGGLTKLKASGSIGHQPAYWKTTKASVEAFAEMGSATLVNPESLSQIKKYFPKSYDFWLEMLEHYGKI